MKHLLAVHLLLMLALVVPAEGAWLTGDPVPAGDEPTVENPLSPTVRRLTLGDAHSHKGLTVWPLYSSRVGDETVYRSLSEALAAGDLIITEKETASVPAVMARNTGKVPVLLLAGEMVTGGRQNRTLRDDTLLPANSGAVELPVLCVEKGRWEGHRPGFDAAPMAGQSVRAGAMSGVAQEEIWDRVARFQKGLGHETPTSDLAAAQASPEVRKQAEACVDAFAEIWVREPVGMVVARWGRIVGVDVFANAGTFAKHRDRLLEAYAVDMLAHDAPTREWRPAPDRPADFLARVHGAPFEWSTTAGLGRLLRLRGNGIAGQALFVGEAVLHAGLVPHVARPRPVPEPMPPIEPMPMPRPIPRPYE